MMEFLSWLVLGAGVVFVVVVFAVLLRSAVNRQVSIDGGRTWHRSDARAHEQQALVDPGLAQVLADNYAAYQLPPTAERWVHVRRQGDVEGIEAREVIYR